MEKVFGKRGNSSGGRKIAATSKNHEITADTKVAKLHAAGNTRQLRKLRQLWSSLVTDSQIGLK